MKNLVLMVGAIAAFTGMTCNPAAAQLPTNFPTFKITTYVTNKVAPGYVFLAVASETPGIGTYLMIIDNDETVVWYREVDTHEVYDFKVQPNGHLSYAPFIEAHSYTGGGDVVHEILDDGYNLKETVTGGNGYVAEGHDFQLLPNGHILQFGYYMSEVDMSELIEGGHPAALVSGGIVQELDSYRNVVFQWRSWDHYPFSDAASTRAVISQFHLNTINQDTDGNLIVGTPTEIRKINRQTGDVMWILGGDDNQFTPLGPGADVSHFGGHATYRIPNGNFLMYDNGNRSATVSSQVHEYTLDETLLTATHVWSWEPTNVIPAWHRGNAQRLPNGNTFIGWGGASGGRHIPACTEVTPEGEVVFELYFDEQDPQVESYRAFRFPYPPETQKLEGTEFEVAQGNTYEDIGGTGVDVEIQSLDGDGYNEVIVVREPYAPVDPFFISKAPRVLPLRIQLDEYAIISMTAQVSFDAGSFGFDDPANLTILHRPTPGQGLFYPLATSYNPVTRKLRATTTQFGEFIFARPDLDDVAFPPILNRPENYRGVQTNMVIAPRKAESNEVYTVNQTLPVFLSWSPKGFARYFELQVDTDPTFASPDVNLQYQTTAFFVLSNALPNMTYHWRVRTMIDDFSTGDWSTNSFQTVAPALHVTTPNGGEMWQRGLDYFIQWNDNIAEDVVIDLYKGEEWLQTIVTNASTGAYEWEVDLGLAPASDYSIRISSLTNATLFDVSDAEFNIDVPEIIQVRKDPDGSMILEWAGTSAGVYVEFAAEPAVQPWTELAGPLYGMSWTNASPSVTTNGYYRLRLE